ncbi:MAG: hypothetical protein JSS09_06700, partial [Verrucomicrobia bacterium]|nr:hypothetical protein [Verrucomicrobiota bacterium]
MFHFLKSENFDLYAAAGPYYYNYKSKQAIGGRARVGVQMYQYVSLELINSYDSRFHENFQGQVGISIPLGSKQKKTKNNKINLCSDSCLLNQRLLQSVKRQEIIVVDNFKKIQIKDVLSVAVDPETGDPYFFVFVDNTSNSLGTFESPYPSLELAQNNSSPGQIIYVFPGDGTTTNMDHGITLQESQKLWGSATLHNLLTTQGLITLPQMSVNAPQITNIDLLGSGATLSTNNEISGITFTLTSGKAVFGSDPITVSLSSCTIDSCGQGDLGIFPVVFESSSPLTATIDSNNFASNPNSGVFIKLLSGASSNQITMNNNQGSNNQATSGQASLLNIEPHGSIGTCELVMTNNIFEDNVCGVVNIADLDTPQDGSFISFKGTFTGNTFTGNAQGITFAANTDNCTLVIQENDLSNCTNGSLAVRAGFAGTELINDATILIDSNQLNGGGSGGDA